MKSSFDLKHNIGKVTPENKDDLWTLKDIITANSLVTAKTPRTIKVMREKEEKVGRRAVVLTIRVEKIELNDSLRLTGKIVEGPENIERGYHSIDVKPGTFLKIEKEWKKWEVEKIKAAKIKQEPVLICILDERDCDFYLLERRPRHLFEIRGGTGKQFAQKSDYYKNVLEEIKRRSQYNHIVIAGPGFAKDEIKKLIDKELMKKTYFDSVSHTGDVGLQELLKRKILEKVVKENRVTKEIEVVEKLLEEINKNGKSVYGLEETKNALESGAVEILLISDKKVREFEDLLELADKVKTKIMIISSEHQSGEKLFRLGGIAGLLRYKI